MEVGRCETVRVKWETGMSGGWFEQSSSQRARKKEARRKRLAKKYKDWIDDCEAQKICVEEKKKAETLYLESRE